MRNTPLICPIPCSIAALQFAFDDAAHCVFGWGFAGPDFELTGALLDEHFEAADGGDAAGLCEFEKRGFERVVDHVEDEIGVEFVFGEGQGLLRVLHTAGRGVDDRVEALSCELRVLEGFGLGGAGEGDGVFMGAVDDEDFGALIDEAEDGGTGCSAGAEDGDARVSEAQMALERADYAGYVCVVAV